MNFVFVNNKLTQFISEFINLVFYSIESSTNIRKKVALDCKYLTLRSPVFNEIKLILRNSLGLLIEVPFTSKFSLHIQASKQ